MKMTRKGLFVALAGVLSGTLASTANAADYRGRYDTYRRGSYFRGRDRDEIRRRGIVHERLLRVAERVDRAYAARAISPREADRLFGRLDYVWRFLREDRYLTDSEFDRRMDDLDDVGDSLRDERREGRYDRYDRYPRDRYRDRYYR